MNRQLLLMALPATLGLTGLIGCESHHHHRDEVVETTVVREAPARERIVIQGDGPEPPLRVEKVVERPRPDAVWHRGHWVREGHSWVWVEGYWR